MNQPTETERLIDLLIITAFTYEKTAFADKRLERDFARYLKLLQIETNTNEEGALRILMNSQEVAAA